ncbi:MAG: phosphate signaling complex protein PhoU [Bacilli bacterium]
MSLNDEIIELDRLIVEMADVVEKNLVYSIGAYLDYIPGKVYEPVDDDKVNHYERIVEEKALNIMLKERTYAKDMRMISGIMTMVEDMERLGDHAEDILRFALKLQNTEKHKNTEIENITNHAMKMVSDSFKAYVNKDLELAKDVIARDDVVDREYIEILECLIQADEKKYISSSFAIYTTLVIKYIERVADHATNIAEWVIYIITGYYKDSQIV